MSHRGMRGPCGAPDEESLIDHLINELIRSQKGYATDGDGNRYYGLDSFACGQLIEVLKRYKKLLTEPIGKLIPNDVRDPSSTAGKIDGVR